MSSKWMNLIFGPKPRADGESNTQRWPPRPRLNNGLCSVCGGQAKPGEWGHLLFCACSGAWRDRGPHGDPVKLTAEEFRALVERHLAEGRKRHVENVADTTLRTTDGNFALAIEVALEAAQIVEGADVPLWTAVHAELLRRRDAATVPRDVQLDADALLQEAGGDFPTAREAARSRWLGAEGEVELHWYAVLKRLHAMDPAAAPRLDKPLASRTGEELTALQDTHVWTDSSFIGHTDVAQGSHIWVGARHEGRKGAYYEVVFGGGRFDTYCAEAELIENPTIWSVAPQADTAQPLSDFDPAKLVARAAIEQRPIFGVRYSMTGRIHDAYFMSSAQEAQNRRRMDLGFDEIKRAHAEAKRLRETLKAQHERLGDLFEAAQPGTPERDNYSRMMAEIEIALRKSAQGVEP